jgi:flagellar motor protein MotB
VLCTSPMLAEEVPKIARSTISCPRRLVRQVGCARLLGVASLIFFPGIACNRGLPAISSSPSGLLTFSPSPGSFTGSPANSANPNAIPSTTPSTHPSPASSLGPLSGGGGLSSNLAPTSTPTLPAGTLPGGLGGLSGGLTNAPSADLENRVRSLDAANQQLTAQLAQSQQQVQLYKDRSDLMQRQLADVAGQLKSRLASGPVSSVPPRIAPRPPEAAIPKPNEFGSSSSRRSGARLSANVSRELVSDPLRDLGYDVEVSSEGLRLCIPSDQLFELGSAQLTASGSSLLDRIAEIIKTNYSDRRIAIEGYTDDSPLYGGIHATSHQLTSAQTDAILAQWTRRGKLPATQFVTLAHGANDPISDNQNPAGRAANRRIEILVRSEGS